jgi:hypothetical protein
MGYAGAGGPRVMCTLSRARPNNSGLVQRAYGTAVNFPLHLTYGG